MFLRRNRRIRNGEAYEYWSLMRTVRTANGPRHELVANLGKAPGLDEGVRHGWEHIVERQLSLPLSDSYFSPWGVAPQSVA